MTGNEVTRSYPSVNLNWAVCSMKKTTEVTPRYKYSRRNGSTSPHFELSLNIKARIQKPPSVNDRLRIPEEKSLVSKPLYLAQVKFQHSSYGATSKSAVALGPARERLGLPSQSAAPLPLREDRHRPGIRVAPIGFVPSYEAQSWTIDLRSRRDSEFRFTVYSTGRAKK